jgi:hypothetical protein
MWKFSAAMALMLRRIDPNTIRFVTTGTEAAPVHVGRRDVDGEPDMLVRL